MDQLKSIVVGVDFTPGSATALAQGARIAGLNQARLHAVHVIETLVAVEMQEALTPYVQEIQDGLLAEARAAWKAFAPEVQGKDQIDFDIAINNSLIELIKRVRDRQADLLVVGTHGATPGKTPGILASQCVRRVPAKVLLTREGQSGPFKRVVACIDFSETSRDALDAAAALAAKDNAALHVLHVYSAHWKRAHKAPGSVSASLEASLRARLDAFLPPGLSAASRDLVESSSDGAGIAEFVKKQGCDLAVIGTRGRTNLRDVLMGSTAERVVRDAPCSILAIKPRQNA